jgi:hypothetical protein
MPNTTSIPAGSADGLTADRDDCHSREAQRAEDAGTQTPTVPGAETTDVNTPSAGKQGHRADPGEAKVMVEGDAEQHGEMHTGGGLTRRRANKKSTKPASRALAGDDIEDACLMPSPGDQPVAEARGGTTASATPVIAGNPLGNPADLPEISSTHSELTAFSATFQLQLHRILSAFPPMSPQQYHGLKESISRAGRLHVPIRTWGGFVVDGLHRLRACMELDITPTFEDWDGQGSLVEYVAGLNAGRRHLTASQKASAALELLPLLSEEAKERQREHGQTAPGRTSTTLPEKIPGVFSGEAREQAARLCGANPHYVSDLVRLKKEDLQLYDQVRLGELKVPKALDVLRSRRQEQAVPGAAHDTPATDAEVAEHPGDGGDQTEAPATDRRAAAPKGGRPGSGKPRTGRGARAEQGPAANSGQDSCRTGSDEPRSGPVPPLSTSAVGHVSSARWTLKAVDAELAKVGHYLLDLARFVHDPEVRQLIRGMDRQRREGHHATFRRVSELLAGMIESLAADEV